ncbi:MAG TPA: flavodoxin FldA [Candidatus Alistipes merdigallinarum]|nr:flavodoxin FldA [Candidatus Alistipes merdigallinarum]
MKTGIFFGSTMGTTEALAKQIAQKLNVPSADIYNVAEVSADQVMDYDLLLFGSSTWGAGDLQDDWYGFVDQLKNKDLTGKRVAFFGCGDSASYPDTFCDALSVLYDDLSGTGCVFVGAYVPEDYTVTDSAVCRDGKFIGLAVDDVNESDKTEDRIDAWIANL